MECTNGPLLWMIGRREVPWNSLEDEFATSLLISPSCPGHAADHLATSSNMDSISLVPHSESLAHSVSTCSHQRSEAHYGARCP
jgi:hypothetical protein